MTVDQLNFFLAQAFDFPAGQGDTCLELVTDEEVVIGFLVHNDCCVVCLVFLGLSHGVRLYVP